MRGALHLGVVPILNIALIPPLLGMFSAAHPGVSLTVEEVSSTEIETAIEEGRMDVGLGFLTRHSPRLRYERLYVDQFALIVHRDHPWAKRRVVVVSELHQKRLLQLPDSFVMRRMTDVICREHQVRPRNVAEINAIETLLRSLGPLKAAALMPKIALRDTTGLIAIRLKGKNLAIEIGLLQLIDSGVSSAVQEFTKLARSTVPVMIRKQKSKARLDGFSLGREVAQTDGRSPSNLLAKPPPPRHAAAVWCGTRQPRGLTSPIFPSGRMNLSSARASRSASRSSRTLIRARSITSGSRFARDVSARCEFRSTRIRSSTRPMASIQGCAWA